MGAAAVGVGVHASLTPGFPDSEINSSLASLISGLIV